MALLNLFIHGNYQNQYEKIGVKRAIFLSESKRRAREHTNIITKRYDI